MFKRFIVLFSMMLGSSELQAQADFSIFSTDFKKVELPFELNLQEMKKSTESFGNDDVREVFVKPFLEDVERNAIKDGVDWTASPLAKFDLSGKDGKFQGYIVSYLLYYPMPDQGAVVQTNYMLIIYDDMGELAVKKGVQIAYETSEGFVAEKSGKDDFRTCKIESNGKGGLILTISTKNPNLTIKKYSLIPDSIHQFFDLKSL